MAWKGFKDIQATIVINLKKSQEELWNNLDKDARWGVKKSQKEKLEVKESENDGEINEFYEIYKQTCKWGGISPKSLEEIKNQNLVFFICKKQKKIIAGAAVKIKKNSVELYLNASLYDYQKFQPNNLLYWEILIWAKNKNFNYFDLGGYQLGVKKGDKLYNINRFKQRWGGELKKYYIYSRNPLKILGRKLIRNSKTAKYILDRLKGRPIQKK